VCLSWPAADLAFAVRDAQPIDALDTPATAAPVGQALLRGYRDQAPLDPDEVRLIPLLQRLTGALTYARLRAADCVVDPEPDWLAALRSRLGHTADRLREALLRPGPLS
jgi:Ser/Thr protein kinase RdoA (MazF antagonist)